MKKPTQVAIGSVEFLKSGEITWVSRSGKTEDRRYVKAGTRIEGLKVKPTDLGVELWDGGWSVLMPRGNIKLYVTTPKRLTSSQTLA